MLPPDPQSNEPLTPEQISALQESISAREQEINIIDTVLRDEEAKLLAAASAIAHLEPAISRARSALAAQQTLLASLSKIKSGFDQSIDHERPNWAEESTAKALCRGLMDKVDNQITSALDQLSETISGLERNTSGLPISIQTMEMEVYNKRLICVAATEHIHNIYRHKKAIEDNITLLKRGFHTFRKIPAETWVKIFVISVHGDMAEYIKQPLGGPIPSTPMKISHVCRWWRTIIAAEKNLWSFAAGHADTSWSRVRLERLKHYISFHPEAPIFVFAPFQSSWPTLRSSIPIKAGDLQLPGRYSLHIIASDNPFTVILLPGNFFPRPTSLTLHLLSGVRILPLDRLLAPFSAFNSLEIIDSHVTNPVISGISETQPQLSRLKLDLAVGNIIQPLDIQPHLGPNLIELYVIHTASQAYSQITTPLSLPHLKILGLMPPDTAFTHLLSLPALKKVILYGTTSHDPSNVITLVHFASAAKHKTVRELELNNWHPFHRRHQTNCNIMILITEILDYMRSIETLRCIDSVIDGALLVKLVKQLNAPSADQKHSSLNTVVIDRCSGITRDNCEAVSQLVTRMDVYV